MDASVTDPDQIVEAVLATKKYRSICPDTVQRIAQSELARRGSFKAALKATKSRLHQVFAAFEEGIDYDTVYRRLAAGYTAKDAGAIRSACREVLHLHSSTAERVSILEDFYPALWAVTGVPHSLLDVGCGLNPLTWPWMGLPTGVCYHALDIEGPRIVFLNRFFELAGLPPLAAWQDAICTPPETQVDVALLLKTSSTLERQDKGSTLRLLQSLRTPFVAVSFSVKSLGGREKGMAARYEREFLSMVAGEPWQVSRLAFNTELVFVVTK